MKASSIQSVVIVLLLCVSLGVMEAGAGTAKTGPGGKPTGPGGKPTGPGGKPTGPGGKPTGPGGKPSGPGGKPTGPGGKPTGPGGKPTGPGGKPSGPGGKPTGPGGKPSGPGGKPSGPGGKPTGPGGKPQPPVKPQRVTCYNRGSKCFLKYVTCPVECPKVQPKDGKSKGCFLDCYSPKCEAVCRGRKPNCNGVGAACFDPRFIGGDGIMFYFHGRSNEHFSLVSDINLQINSRFIGLRPAGRTRDYTWIQALGLMFGSHTFTLEATRTEKWDGEEDHLQFSYDGEALSIPEGLYSGWTSPENNLKVERIASKNSATVTLSEAVEISVNVIPVTEEDNRIHNYQIPSNDSFAHLEVQFRFFNLSAQVEGVLGQTYQPNFHNTAKVGVAMPIVGGADKYRTSSLLSADCKSCLFSPSNNVTGEGLLSMEYATLDCTGGVGSGNGIVCRK